MSRTLAFVLALTLCAAVLPEPIWAQEITWSRIFSDGLHREATCVQQTADGGYVLVGWGAWLVKMDAAGNEQWERTFGGGHRNPNVEGVAS